MRKSMMTVLGVLGVIFVAACSEKSTEMTKTAEKLKQGKFHGDSMETKSAAPKKTVVEALKSIYLNGYPKKTIGAAFDTYSKVANREWREDLGRDGKYYVDFICWFPSLATSAEAKKFGVTKQGLNIKFAVQEDGTAYVTLGTKLSMMSDGRVLTEVVPLTDVPKIIDIIYADQELTF